jgi:MFS family permease
VLRGRAVGAARSVGPALALLALIGFIAQVGISVMLPLLPVYATELGAPPFVLGLLTSSFAVTNAIGQLGSGFLSERTGARRVMTAGVALYASMNALIATAASASWLLAWRTLAGFGGGAMIVTERIYVAQVADPARRAFANGIVSAAQSAGSVAGPALAAVALDIGGLRAPFVLVAVTSGLAFVGTLFLPRPVARLARHEEGPVAVEPPLQVGSLAILLAANVALLASYGAFITTYGPMATGELGWSTAEVAIAFSFFGGGSIVLGPALAHLADRIGRRQVAMVAPLPLCAFALVLVAGMPQPVVYATAFLGGGGLTAFSAAWYALLAEAAGERRLARTFGVISAASAGGIVFGAMAAAELWTRVDVVAGMLLGGVTPLLAGLAMFILRGRPLQAVPA